MRSFNTRGEWMKRLVSLNRRANDSSIASMKTTSRRPTGSVKALTRQGRQQDARVYEYQWILPDYVLVIRLTVW